MSVLCMSVFVQCSGLCVYASVCACRHLCSVCVCVCVCTQFKAELQTKTDQTEPNRSEPKSQKPNTATNA